MVIVKNEFNLAWTDYRYIDTVIPTRYEYILPY